MIHHVTIYLKIKLIKYNFGDVPSNAAELRVIFNHLLILTCCSTQKNQRSFLKKFKEVTKAQTKNLLKIKQYCMCIFKACYRIANKLSSKK